MNSLSWFLYLADAVGRVSWLCLALVVPITIVYGFHQVFAWIDYGDEKQRRGDADKALVYHSFKKAKWFYIASITSLLLLYAITPDKGTVYLIAGSEAGEYVVTSPEGQEIINDIKAIIKNQINDLK